VIVSYGQNVLTDDMINQVNSTPKEGIFSIAETVKFDKQILRADEIVFAPNSTLELTNMDYDWIILIADKIKFTAPLKKATIKRGFEIYASDGDKGEQGLNGNNGSGTGSNGTNGQDGKKGGKGNTKQLPNIYIVTNQVTSQKSNLAPDYINLKLILPGIDGGRGGIGGEGGDGGNGTKGVKGANGVVDCRRGGGDGGNGGNAGKGGQGGDSGNGGDGANIVFIGTDSALEVLSYSIIINTGGDSGIPGRPGQVGFSGNGGAGGDGTFYCSGGDAGRKGLIPNPKNNGIGQLGEEGSKGKIDKVLISKYINLQF